MHLCDCFTGPWFSMWLHEFAGYAVLVLIASRVIWGLIGPRYARFSNFIYKPSVIKEYLKSLMVFKARRYLGHNPAGGAMVIILLVMLTLTSVTGIEALEPVNAVAKYSSTVQTGLVKVSDDHDEDKHEGSNESGNELMEDIHEFLANFTLLLIIIHIAGVLFSSIAHGENLVRAMWTGYKDADEPASENNDLDK